MALAIKPQVDVRGLCQYKPCHGTLEPNKMPYRASVWVAWPKIGIICFCEDCWEDIRKWEVELHASHRSPDDWYNLIKHNLRQRYE